MFGMISNQPKWVDNYAKSLMDVYGISPKRRCVYKGTRNMTEKEYAYKGFKEEDMIRMEFMISNGTECKLSFYNESKNNKFLYSMNLPNTDKIVNI